MTRQIFRYGFVLAASIATVVGGIANSRPAESLVVVSVVADVRHPSYVPAPVDTVLVLGERVVPLRVDVANYTSGYLSIGEPDTPWHSALSVQLETLGETQAGGAARRDIAVLASRGKAEHRLPPRGRISVNVLIADRGGRPLRAGRYRVSATLNPVVLEIWARRLRNLLYRELSIEFRDPEGPTERVEHILQLAHEANNAGRTEEVRALAAQALAINPDSIPALNDLGSSHLRAGDCERGAPVLRRAIMLLQNGGDSELHRAPHAREELADSLQQHLLRRCGP
jgi:hypothetical protein